MGRWLLTHPLLAPLLPDLEREPALLDASGEAHRMDGLWTDGQAAVVLEYKTGGADAAHAEQARRYLRLLRDMGHPGDAVRAHLVYLDRRTVETILLEDA